MNRALGHGHGVRLGLKRDGPEGLFVLGDVLAEDVPQRFGLLRAQINTVRVLDGDVLRRLLMDETEGEEEVPYADAYLNTVGVALAVFLRFCHLDLRLGLGGVHSAFRVFQIDTTGMVRKGGLEPPRVAPPDPKSGASANFATFANQSLQPDF